MKGKACQFAELSVPISRPDPLIALAQIEGPRPNGKIVASLEDGSRDTYVWKNAEEADARAKSCLGIVDSVHERHPDLDILVFPEYSLPIQRALPSLKEKADRYGTIIVAGSDNFRLGKQKRICNHSPVLIPNHQKPVWITKRQLSKWELGFVDPPYVPQEPPAFCWHCNGKMYWFSVFVCLDFSLALKSALCEMKEPGLYIVPMASPNSTMFWAHADTHLSDATAGRAVLLCNAVGGDCEGRSAVFAMTPVGKHLEAAFRLSRREEQVGVFRLNMDRLIAPKKTRPGFASALGEQSRYLWDTSSKSGRLLKMRGSATEAGAIRAVVNPSLFNHYRRTMRIAFLEVSQFRSMQNELDLQNFEVLSVLGQHDIVATHLNQDIYRMIYDIGELKSVRVVSQDSENGNAKTLPIEQADFPHFEVEKYYKVLGIPIDERARQAFTRATSPPPTQEELAKLIALANDWDSRQVPKSERDTFLDRLWILDKTTKRPGDIHSLLSVFVKFASGRVSRPIQMFEDFIIPDLIEIPTVTSIYRGTGHNLPIHFLLRVTSEAEELFGLTEMIHDLAYKYHIMIGTTTYVVARRWSSLSLEQSLLKPTLPLEEEEYRNHYITPLLNEDERAAWLEMSEEQQRQRQRLYRRIDNHIRYLGGEHWTEEWVREKEKRTLQGLLHEDLSQLKELHDEALKLVEQYLRENVKSRISKDLFKDAKKELGLLKHKTRENLSYAELIQVALWEVGHDIFPSSMKENLDSLFLNTKNIRNAFAHGDWEDKKITMEEYAEGLAAYCTFLRNWVL